MWKILKVILGIIDVIGVIALGVAIIFGIAWVILNIPMILIGLLVLLILGALGCLIEITNDYVKQKEREKTNKKF